MNKIKIGNLSNREVQVNDGRDYTDRKNRRYNTRETEIQDHLNEFEEQPPRQVKVSSCFIIKFVLTVWVILMLWANYQQRKVIDEYEQLFKRIEELTKPK